MNGVSTDAGKAFLAAGVTLTAAVATALTTWKKDPLGNSRRSRIVREGLERVRFWTEWEALLKKVGSVSDLEHQRICEELHRASIEVRISQEPETALFHSRKEFDLYRADLPVYRRFALLYPLPRLHGLTDQFAETTGRKTAALFVLQVLRWFTSMMHWFIPLSVLLDTFLSAHLWLNLLIQGDTGNFYREQVGLWQFTVGAAFVTWLIHLFGKICEAVYLSHYPFPKRELP